MTGPQLPDYYAVLGVAKDATPEQIKQAWRRSSSAAHPDKHPDNKDAAEEKMAAINRAYEVLSDPERRKDYDAHGVDHDASAIAEEGRMQLMELFDRVVTDEQVMNIVGHIRHVLRMRIAECQAEVASAHKIVARLKRVRGRVKVKKDGVANMFHAIVDKKIGNVERTIPQNQRMERVVNAALQILADYENVDDAFDTRHLHGGLPELPGGPLRFFLGNGGR